MSFFQKILAVLFITLLSAGCGSDSKGKKTKNNDDSVSDPYLKSLLGTWTRTCTQGQKLVANVAAQKISVSADSFVDANCSQPFASMTSEATFTAGQAWNSSQNAKAMSFVFGDVYLTPKSSTAVGLMNSGKVCGFTDWKSGERKLVKIDMPNCQNSDFSEFKGLQNQVFQVEDNVLKIFKSTAQPTSAGFILGR